TKPHIEISKVIKNLGFVVKDNNKSLLSGIEVDILIESHKLCIEYDGLYYHTERNGKDRNYHLNKTILANNLGYSLIHIFEDEWIRNKNLILNKIIHLIGCSNVK